VADDIERMWPLGGQEPELEMEKPAKRSRQWIQAKRGG
jgi:hypothetical protein